MIDINGITPFAKLSYKQINQKFGGNFGVGLGGRVQEIKDFKWLDKTHNYDVPLYPQHTVVQFNSTYMELPDRQDITIAKEWFSKSCKNGNEDGCEIYQLLD